MPSAVAAPSPAPAPTTSEVRADRPRMSTAIAPTGIATPYPASKPEISASPTRGSVPAGPPQRDRFQVSDVEAQRPELFPAVLSDLVRSPRRHPDPVDPDVVDEPAAGSLAQRLAGLVLDDVGQRAGGRGERHVHGRDVLLVDVDAVHQPEVDHVDAELRVDDVLESLFDVGDRSRHDISPTFATARAVASLNAIHDSSAHLTRAGYFATPAKATPSSSSSSSGSTWPRPDISATNASCRASASVTVCPDITSCSTLAEARLIELPIPSNEISSIASPASRTRIVTSSPQVGLTWCASASKGSRSPRPCGCL